MSLRLICIIFSFFISQGYAQSLLATSGFSFAKDSSFVLDFSVGEISSPTLTASSYVFTIGYQQPSSHLSPLQKPAPDSILHVYEFLSPNEDGDNDVFYIRGITGYPDNEVLVFDRHSKVVFTKKNYDNSWTGDHLLDGSYFYVVKIPSKNIELKGGLVIAR